MVKVFDQGKCVYHSPSVMEIRQHCIEEQNTLWDETRRLINPHEVYVDLSDRLYQIKKDLLNKMHPEES
jgi:nicotinate phosphoribosyltransferase